MLIVLYPSLVGFTLVINSFFIIYKGAKGIGLNKIDVGQAFAISFGIGSVGALITVPFIPYIKNYVNKKISNHPNIEDISTTIENNQHDYNINNDVELKTVLEIHDKAEKFDPKIEETYKYLQGTK